jgi:hypothetical protein
MFVRYWDNALTVTELEELARRLMVDPVARERFQEYCLQAVAAADLAAVADKQIVLRAADFRAAAPASARPSARWSRRRLLGFVGSGIAAAVAAGFVGWRFRSERPTTPVQLAETGGEVTLRSGDGKIMAPNGLLPPSSTLFTNGPLSWAMLRYPDGTGIALAGDSAATVTDNGYRMLLRRGTATAEIPTKRVDANSLTLATAEARLSNLNGVVMTLRHMLQRTEVGVHQGLVTVAATTGGPPAVVRGGEMLTVQANGDQRKQVLRATPDEFALDLMRPLPNSWQVGERELTADGPVLHPQFYFDPFHYTKMWQIRSDQQWAKGFFRLFPESVLRVRYWVDRPGPSQVNVCVRTERLTKPATGVVECNDAFAEARPRAWQWLEVKAGDMLDNPFAPRFGPPWVGFLLVINTYEQDLGLKIAEYQVTRPHGPGGKH